MRNDAKLVVKQAKRSDMCFRVSITCSNMLDFDIYLP